MYKINGVAMLVITAIIMTAWIEHQLEGQVHDVLSNNEKCLNTPTHGLISELIEARKFVRQAIKLDSGRFSRALRV